MRRFPLFLVLLLVLSVAADNISFGDNVSVIESVESPAQVPLPEDALRVMVGGLQDDAASREASNVSLELPVETVVEEVIIPQPGIEEEQAVAPVEPAPVLVEAEEAPLVELVIQSANVTIIEEVVEPAQTPYVGDALDALADELAGEERDEEDAPVPQEGSEVPEVPEVVEPVQGEIVQEPESVVEETAPPIEDVPVSEPQNETVPEAVVGIPEAEVVNEAAVNESSIRNAALEVVPQENVSELVRENAALQFVDAGLLVKDAAGKSLQASVRVTDPVSGELVAESGRGIASEVARVPQKPLVVSIELGEGPVKKIEITDAVFGPSFIRVDDTPESAVAGREFLQLYAIDPSSLSFTEAEVTVTAKGTSLYKCAEWDFDARSCGGSWALFKSGLTPGEVYTFTMNSSDPAFGEINATAAIHLDASGEFVRDIFAEVVQIDGVWSGGIAENESVRVTFERNLTDGNVIDFLARDNGTVAFVEVYVANTSYLVGSSGVAGIEEMQYVSLQDVPYETDVFDLRVVKRVQELAVCSEENPDCNDAAIAENGVAAMLEFDFIHDAPISAAGADGLVAYTESAVNAPRYRLWNSTATAFTAEATNTVDPGAQSDWLTVKANHEREEFILMQLDENTNTSVQRYNGTAWTNFQALAFDNPNTAQSSFDFSVEKMSGDVFLLYETSTAADTTIGYRIWNGTAYGAEQTYTHGVASPVRWAKTVAKGNSDEIMILTHTTSNDLTAVLWTGNAIDLATQVNASGALGAVTNQVFDFEWMGQSGNGLLMYRSSGAPSTISYRIFNATTRAWGAETTFFTLNSGALTQMRMCSDPTSDYVGWVGHDGTGDTNFRIWNGTGVETTPAPPTEDTDAEPPGAGGINVDCAFEKQSGRGIFAYVQNGAAVDDAVTFCTYNKTAWSAASLPACTVGPDLSASGGSLETIELFPHPVTNELMVLGFNIDEDLTSARWTGAAWANITALETVLDCLNGVTQCGMFDWNRFDTNPNVTIVVPLNDTNFTRGSVVNVTVNASDNINVSRVNLTVVLPNGTQRAFTPVRVSGTNASGRYELNFTETLARGRYNFTAQALDNSAHNNTNSTSGFFNIDFMPPAVFDVRPVANSTYNLPASIEIAANVTDNLAVDRVSANVTLPNGTVQQVNLTLAVGNKYNVSFTIPLLLGQYNVTFVANDTSNNTNTTVSTFFVGVDTIAPAVFDVVPAQNIYTNVTGIFELAANVTDAFGVGSVVVNVTYANGTNETLPLLPVGGDKYNRSFTLLAIEGVNRIVFVANDTSGNVNASVERLIVFDTSNPLVDVVYPLGQNVDYLSVVGLVLNITDDSPLDNISAEVADPNGTVYQVGNFSLGLESDNFTSDTNGTNWVMRNDSIAPGQACTADIDTSVSGKMFISITGTSASSVTHCGFNSLRRMPGDFDVILDFNVTLSEDDTFLSFRANSEESLFAVGRRVFIDWDNTTGSPRYVLGYNSGGGTTQAVVPVSDSFGRFRIVRSNTTFSNENRFNLMYYNFTNASWADPLGSFLMNTTRAQVIQVKATSTASNYGQITVEAESVEVVSDGTYIGAFNETVVLGVHNVTFFVNDTLGFANDTENTSFNVTPANSPPSRPFIVEPDPGDAVKGLFNITWTQVFDSEGDAIFFNITLLNTDLSFNATIVSDLPDVPSPLTFYEWNTSLFPEAEYSLRITAFQNVSNNPFNTNDDTLAGTFWIDRSSPLVIPDSPANGSVFEHGAQFEIAANITDLTAVVAVAHIAYPNGTVVNLSLNESVPGRFNASFIAPLAFGQYNVTFNATDLAQNINDTETLVFFVQDNEGPLVVFLSPAPSSSFLVNETVNVTVNVTDDTAVDEVVVEVTYPDGSAENYTTDIFGSLYNLTFVNVTQRGNYTVRAFANDTVGNVNGSEVVVFTRRAFNVIDVINTTGGFVPYTIDVLANASGVLDLQLNFSGHVNQLNISLHNESSPLSILRLDDVSPFNQSVSGGFAFYAIDLSGLNFTNATAGAIAVGDSFLYTCKDYNFTDRDCFGNWTEVQSISPGVAYTVLLTPGDPGFLETSSAADVALAPINNTAFVVAFVDTGASSVGFRIMNTNGTIILNTTTVDSTADNTSRVDVVMLNSSHFAVSWVDGPEDDVTMQLFLVNGSNTTSPTDVDTAVGLNTDVSLAELDDRFVVCYANDADGDADFQTFFNNGSLAVGELNVDGAINPSATLQNLVDCSGVTASNWTYLWFDDGTNDVTLSIQNETGASQTGQVDLDIDVGETAQVAVSAVSNDTFGAVYYDSAVQDIIIEIRYINNTVRLGPTVIDADAGAVSRVAAGAVKVNETSSEDAFVVAWLDNASNDIKAAVYLQDGTELAAPFTVVSQPNITFQLLDVSGRAETTNTSVCPGRFIVAYSAVAGAFSGFFTNGSAWDGSCDLFAPLVFDVRPVADSVFEIGETIEVAANVTDDVAVDAVIANITYPNGTVAALPLVLVPSTNKYNASFVIPIPGVFNVSFFANDTSGKQNNTEVTNFTALFVAPQVSAFKTDTPDPVGKGGQLLYQIVINNSGNGTAFNVTVVEGYPAGVVFDSSSPAPSSGNGTFNLGNLAANTSFTINITVNVSLSLANGTVLNNTFNATFNNQTGDNFTVSNSTLTTVLGIPVIFVVKADAPDPVVKGGQLNYTIFLNNTGDDTAFNVTLVDVYPPSVVFVSSSPAPSSGNGTFVLGNFSPNTSATINITVNVSRGLANGSVLSNLANVSFQNSSGGNLSSSDAESTTVLGFAEIFTNKSDSPDPIVKGSTLNYQILINNTGDEVAYNVTVVEGYPANVTFNGSQPSPTLGNNTFVISAVQPNSSFTINITVNVSTSAPNGSVLNNSYNLTFANASGVNLTVTNSTTTTVVGAAQIVSIKNDNPDPVVRGQQLNYTIIINNTGDDTAYNVTLTDIYPSGVVFVSSSPAPTAGNGTYLLGNFSPNQSATVNITVNVSRGLANGTVLNNTALVQFTNGTGLNGTSTDSELTTVLGFPEVNTNKSDAPDPVFKGQTLRYQILINNTGDEVAYNVTVVEGYPANVTFNGSQPSPTLGNNTFVISAVQPNSSFTINITVNVSTSAPNGSVLNNSYNLTFANASGVNTTFTNSTTTTVLGAASILVTKADAPDPVVKGSQLNYTVNLTNTGDDVAFNVTLVEVYPSGVVFVSSSPSPTAGNGTFSLGNFSPNQSTLVNITVNVSRLLSNGSVLSNLVNVSFQNSSGGNLTSLDSESTTVIGFPEIFTNKSDVPDPVSINSSLRYTITINNTGDEIAYNVTVIEVYPANVTFNSSSPAPTSGNNTFSVGTLQPNGSATINISLNVSFFVQNGSVIENNYTVTFANASGINLTVSNSTNTTVTGVALVVVSKADSADPITRGSLLNYTINITNYDGENAYNVTLVESYPPNVSFVGASPAPILGNNTFSVGNLLPLSSFLVNVTVNVSPLVPNGTVLNNRVNVTFANASGQNATVNASEVTTILADSAPVVSLVAPANQTNTTNTTVLFYFNVTDDVSALLNCSFGLNGTASGVNASTLNGTLTNFSASGLAQGNRTWDVSCIDLSLNANTSESRLFTVDFTPPNLNALTLVPDGADALDPGVLINFSADVDDNFSAVSTVVLHVVFNGSSFVNLSMSADAVTGLWNVTFTPVFAGNYSFFITANDTAGNNDTSIALNRTIDFESTWTRSPAGFGATAFGPNQTQTIGTLVVNNTGDFNISFTLNSTFENMTFNMTNFTLAPGQVGQIEVNATAPSAFGTFPYNITINASGNATPQFNVTTGAIVVANDAFLFAFFSILPVSVTQGQAGVTIEATVTNIGTQNVSNVTLNISLPAGWVLTGGSLGTVFGEIEPNASETLVIAVQIPANAAVGLQNVTTFSDGFNNSGVQLSAINQTFNTTEQVLVIASVPFGPGGGGGGGGAGAGAGAGGGGGAPGGAFARTNADKPVLVTNEWVEVLRGTRIVFPLEVFNYFQGSTMERVDLEVEGYARRYVRWSPEFLIDIPYGESRSFEIELDAPLYREQSEVKVTFIITSKLKGSVLEDTPSGKKFRIVEDTIVEYKTVTIHIREASPEQVGLMYTDVERLYNAIVARKYPTKRSDALRALFAEQVSAGEYEEAAYLSSKLKVLLERELEAGDVIARLRGRIDDARADGLETGETERILALAQKAFEREDFDRAIALGDSALAINLLESEGAQDPIEYLKRNWWAMLIAGAGLGVAGYFGYRRARMVQIGYRLDNMLRERIEVHKVMREVQDAYFVKREMGGLEFNSAMRQGQRRLEQLAAKAALLRMQRAALLPMADAVKVAQLERRNAEQGIKDAQDAYFVKRMISRRRYELRLEVLRMLCSELDAHVASLKKKVKP